MRRSARNRVYARLRRAREVRPQLELSDGYGRDLGALSPHHAQTTTRSGSGDSDLRPLGTYKSNVATAEDSEWAKAKRRKVLALQRLASRLNPDDGPRALPKCGCRATWAVDEAGQRYRPDRIAIYQGETGRATFGGVLRCSSVWCCPDCASQIAFQRGEELEYLLGAHQDAAGGAVFVTLTTRHSKADRLGPLRRAVSGAWTKTLNDGRVRRRLAEIGYIGATRALEVTVGSDNGWHPHVHGLLFLESPITNVQLEELEDLLFDVWCRKLIAAGFAAPLRRDRDGNALGVVAEHVTRKEVGRYIAKMGIALEVSTSLGKAARGTNRTMWQVLEDIQANGLDSDVALWREWAVGMLRARQLTWSGKIRDRYDLGAELSDEELLAQLAAVESERGEPIAHIDRPVFEAYSRVPGWRAHVLEVAESDGGSAVMEFVQLCLWDWTEIRRPPPWWWQIGERQ